MQTKTEKKEMVRQMFDDISPKYDFLNHLLSFGIDRTWRKKLVNMVKGCKPATILDVATGTGDLAIALIGAGADQIKGVDISKQMLAVGIKKVTEAGLDKLITFNTGDAEHLPFPDNSFDVVTVAFGVRNFSDLALGIREMSRVLKPGGKVYILEFSHPGTFPVKQLYQFYSRYFIPFAGKLISGNSVAYNYLPESVAAFPSGENFVAILRQEGLHQCSIRPLSFGIASIYAGQK